MARTAITPEDGVVYEFAPSLEPVVEVEPGTELTLGTVDSLEGAIDPEDDVIDAVPKAYLSPPSGR